MRAPGARSACTSPIFVRCASPPGTARATPRAQLCPARAPRGSTCGPRGAGGPSGPWGSTRTCSARASSLGRSALVPRDIYPFILVFTPPVKHTKSTPSRAGAPACGPRRAVRAPVGDAAAPFLIGTCFMDGGRRAGRLSAATDPCHSAVGGAAAHGPCTACAALARLWRRTSTTRDRPARQPRTASHRSADASRSVPIAGGEIELALLRHCAGHTAGFVQGALRALCSPRLPGCVPGRRHTPALALAAASWICTSACAPNPITLALTL